MSTPTAGRPADSTTYDPRVAAPAAAPSSQALITEAIECILGGRAFPPHLRPTVFATPPRPATVQEGIARILAR